MVSKHGGFIPLSGVTGTVTAVGEETWEFETGNSHDKIVVGVSIIINTTVYTVQAVAVVGDTTTIAVDIRENDASPAVGDSVDVTYVRVDDFRHIDITQLISVLASASQELDRRLQAEQAKTAALETANAALTARLDGIEARLAALEQST